MLKPLKQWPPLALESLNWVVTAGSVLLCALALPLRLPGMELSGLGPNWLLIWVVAWSVQRTLWQGALAGIILGLIQDGMTAPQPTHTLGLVLVGVLTARLQKQRFVEEDFISVALIVFGMAIVAETVTALQLSLGVLLRTDDPGQELSYLWQYYQQTALSSAILSSLWAPVVYHPLKRWWAQFGNNDFQSVRRKSR
jgi:rod shape-determining protein MreD